MVYRGGTALQEHFSVHGEKIGIDIHQSPASQKKFNLKDR
jgi:hypothetical protein